ncbi:predicted protein [Chaetoceros tenuissimus]|uniref:Uncharacterized protein n=1 Tax=Chaetoceros tenuissimus TaxID=426638 RepID=A0AAD3CGH5_9STRA|nr:predicted protein [Chaetoceros tenuissimus]
MQDGKGNTILHQLSQQNYVSEEYWKILAFETEINVMRNKDDKTALDLAYESETWNCIDILIFVEDQHGKTALHKACEGIEYDQIKMCLEAGGKELLMKQDAEGNSALHMLPTCCESHKKHFDCVQDMIKFGGKDLLHITNDEGDKPSLTSSIFQNIELQVDSEQTNTQQLLQAEIENLKKELIGEGKRGKHEIEIVKKLHEEGMVALEEKEIEILRLQEVEISMKADLDSQKLIIEKFQLELQQQTEVGEKVEEAYLTRIRKTEKSNKRLQRGIFAQNEIIEKKEEKIMSLEEVISAKEHENIVLKKEIKTLKSKRSRGEKGSGETPSKRSKTNDTTGSAFQTAFLESEIEELIEELKKEKESHARTLTRLENARNS